MMAHLALPNIDPSGVPATYSKILIEDYLRDKLKFNGLVITDDLEMTGASIDRDIGERAVKAFLAGNDMLMLAGSPVHQKRAFEAVLAAVRSKRISEARLTASVVRILAYKKELKLGPFGFSRKRTQAAISKLEDLSREVLKKNFRLSMAGKTASWPQIHRSTEALVLSADKKFYDSFAAGFKGKTTFFRLTPASLDRSMRELNNDRYQMVVFYATGSQTTRWLAKLNSDVRAKILVVNVNNSGELDAQKSFLSVLNINSFNPESGFALAEALCSTEFRVPASGEDADQGYDPPSENGE